MKTSMPKTVSPSAVPASFSVSTPSDQPSFDEALAAYGEQGVIDLFSTIGYYAMLACLIRPWTSSPRRPAKAGAPEGPC